MSGIASAQVGVLVVDDQGPFRRAMSALVDGDRGPRRGRHRRVGEESVAAADLALDLVLMDVNLLGIDGSRLRAGAAGPRHHPSSSLRLRRRRLLRALPRHTTPSRASVPPASLCQLRPAILTASRARSCRTRVNGSATGWRARASGRIRLGGCRNDVEFQIEVAAY